MKLEELIFKETGVKAFSHDGGLVYMVDRQGYVRIFRALKKLCDKYTVVFRTAGGWRYKFYTKKGKVFMDVTEVPAKERKKRPDYMIVIREVAG